MSTYFIHMDNLEGSAAEHALGAGWSITRTATITTDDIFDDTGDAFEIVLMALETITGERGSPCPSISVPTYLERFIPELVGPQVIKVRIVYRGYPLPYWEFGGSLNQVRTFRDKDGVTPLKTTYTYPASGNINPERNTNRGPFEQGAEIMRLSPEPVCTLHFTVFAFGDRSATDELTAYKNLFEGYTNSETYWIGKLCFLKHQGLILSVNGVSRDGGLCYEASMTFQFRKATWDHVITYIDPDTGQPPPDLVEGDGYKRYDYSPECVFPTIYKVAN